VRPERPARLLPGERAQHTHDQRRGNDTAAPAEPARRAAGPRVRDLECPRAHRGLRIEKTTPAGTTRYSWDDQERLVRETDGSGSVLARYTWGGPNELVAIEKNGAAFYPHSNARGDILAVTDSTGIKVATYEYGPWGELLSSTGTFQQPWRYAGYYHDSDTRPVLPAAALLQPTLSRFLSEEPMFSDFCTDCGFQALLDNAPTTSAYAYANNRPTVMVDPDGRKPCERWQCRAGRHVKKNWRGYATGVAFGACVIFSAGACVAAGAALATANYAADGRKHGYGSRKALNKFGTNLAWTAAGGGFGRIASGSWRGSAVETVKWTRKVGRHAVGGPRNRTYRRIIKGQTARNMATNGIGFYAFNGLGAW
jgi:RHS repeat-associated protein